MPHTGTTENNTIMAKTKKTETEELQEQIDKSAKLFDVAQPANKVAAQPTSRPIITRHNAGMKQDPMVTTQSKKTTKEVAVDTDNANGEAMIHKQIKIEPLTLKAEAEKPEEPAPEEAPEALTEPTEAGSPAVNEITQQITAKQADKKQKQDMQAHADEIEQLIASKHYFVPIGQVNRRRSHYRVILALVVAIALMAVCLNFAIDAEAIDIGIDALTNII